MEFKQPDGRKNVCEFRYQLTEEGFVYGRANSRRIPVTAWLESGFLVFRPAHGMETWSKHVAVDGSEDSGMVG